MVRNYEGNLGRTLAELVHAHESRETFVEESEEVHHTSLLAQVERAERGFRAGRFTTWEEVKRRNRM